jgi:3-phenylpropionate/trans-cinnamate dioxygenase ferredoxin reductase component
VPGGRLDGIHYLRTLADSRLIRERIESAGRLVVVGSGWIGAEIAASAREKGCEVTMIEMASLPLERVLGPELGEIYVDLHRGHGVEFLPETTVDRFEGHGSVERVVTHDGSVIETDFVVIGIGAAPRAGLVETAGVQVDNGVLVDEHLEASVPGVFAAGDVANARHPFYGRPLRVEHWANALKQGPVAARAMLGKPASYDEIPYFFSDQYEASMEYSGYATEWDEVVFRGDVAAREFVAFWLKGGRLIAGLNMNVWDVSDPIRELIRSRRRLDLRQLTDPDVPFSKLLAPEPDDERALGAWAAEGGSF